MTYCVSIPVTVTAGLSFKASATAPAYPAPAWALSLLLRGPSVIDLVADDTGAFSATAAETADWLPGAYWWEVRASDGTDVERIERGDLVVAADLAAAGANFDGRTDNEKALEAITAVIAKRATIDQERYRINNRELYRTPIKDLIALRGFYARLVASDKRKLGCGRSGWGRPVRVNFQ